LPTIYRHKGYRFFFFSNEGYPNEPVHIHVRKGSQVAKFWLEPEVILESSYEISSSELKELEEVIREKQESFKEAWNAYFGDRSSSKENMV